MHDVGKSAWNFLWLLLPIIGWIILFIYTLEDSEKGTNKWGASEKYPDAEGSEPVIEA